MSDYIMTLKDGGVRAIKCDCERSSGCPTCNYGSSYVNFVKIQLDSCTINIGFDMMYHYGLRDHDSNEVISAFEIAQMFDIQDTDITEAQFIGHVVEYIAERAEYHHFSSTSYVIHITRDVSEWFVNDVIDF